MLYLTLYLVLGALVLAGLSAWQEGRSVLGAVVTFAIGFAFWPITTGLLILATHTANANLKAEQERVIAEMFR